VKPLFSTCSALAAILIGSEIAKHRLAGTWVGAVIALVVTALLTLGVWILRKRSAAKAKAPPPKPFGTIALGVGLFVGIGGLARILLIWFPQGVPEARLIAGTLAGIAVVSGLTIVLVDKASSRGG
jgi:hypothetical protein